MAQMVRCKVGVITVTKQMRTETGHRLMDYDGRCAHLHGHSYLWEVTATAPELSANSMIIDFKDLKRAMKYVLDPFDHAMILHHRDTILPVLQTFLATNGHAQRVFALLFNPTAENFAAHAAKNIQGLLPDITVTSVRVWETATSYAEWRKDDQ